MINGTTHHRRRGVTGLIASSDTSNVGNDCLEMTACASGPHAARLFDVAGDPLTLIIGAFIDASVREVSPVGVFEIDFAGD
jgi:hypothetical protein